MKPKQTEISIKPTFNYTLDRLPLDKDKNSLFRIKLWGAYARPGKPTPYAIYAIYENLYEDIQVILDKIPAFCHGGPASTTLSFTCVCTVCKHNVCTTYSVPIRGCLIAWTYVGISQIPLKKRQRRHRLVANYCCSQKCLDMFNLTPILYHEDC